MGKESDKEELSSLVKNIHKGLQTYGVKELNDALTSLLEKKSTKTKKVEVVFQCVCNEYDINLKQLLYSTARKITGEARPIAIALLHFNLGLTFRKISRGVFERKYYTFVANAIKRHKTLDVSLKQDREYKERYDRIELAIKNKSNK